MEDTRAEVAVLILCYNGREYLDDCLTSVLGSDDGGITRHVVVVDNASTDGSGEHVAEHFPQVDLVHSEVNRGFAGGNNFGWEHVRRAYPRAEFLVLLNQDTVVSPGWLRPLVALLRAQPNISSAQPKLLMHSDPRVINSAGNRSHFLGFGFVGGCGETDRGQYDRPRPVNYASGEAVMLRTEHLRQYGLFEDLMYMYLEDADVSWRLRQLGFHNFLTDSVVYHKYSFGGRYGYYYHLEKNRLWLLAVYYKLPTLLLLAPALVAMELGQWGFALARGLGRQKARSYAFLLRPATLALLARRRRRVQGRRRISDREFMQDFTGGIDFPELTTPLLRYVANPVYRAYWAIARRVMCW